MQRRVKGAALRAALRPFTTTRQLVQDVAPIFGVDLSYALQARMKRNDALKVLLDAHLRNGVPRSKLAEVDLLAAYQRRNQKMWSAFKLEGVASLTARSGPLTPREVGERVGAALGTFFHQHTLVVLREPGVLWMRIELVEDANRFANSVAAAAAAVGGNAAALSRSKTGSAAMYLLAYPSAPYVLVSHMKKAFREYVEQALASVFGCSKLEPVGLRGKKVDSLTQMLFFSESQGAYSALRVQAVDENPLDRRPKVNQTARELDSDEEEEAVETKKRAAQPGKKRAASSKVERLDKEVNKRRRAHNHVSFGKDELPEVPRVSFTTSLLVASADGVSIGSKKVVCDATFEGDSVLEGLRELVKHGLADPPLPGFLADLHSHGRSRFFLSNSEQAPDVEMEDA